MLSKKASKKIKKVLKIRTYVYLLVEQSLTEAQRGFIKHNSCTTQLLYMYLMIESVLDASAQVDVV